MQYEDYEEKSFREDFEACEFESTLISFTPVADLELFTRHNSSIDFASSPYYVSPSRGACSQQLHWWGHRLERLASEGDENRRYF